MNFDFDLDDLKAEGDEANRKASAEFRLGVTLETAKDDPLTKAKAWAAFLAEFPETYAGNVDAGVGAAELVRTAWSKGWTLKTDWSTATPIPSDNPGHNLFYAEWAYTDEAGDRIRGCEDIRERLFWYGGRGVLTTTVVKPEVTR